MKKCFLALFLFIALANLSSARAETVTVETGTKQPEQVFKEQQESGDLTVFGVDSEYGWVDQGNRDGFWKLLALTVAYNNIGNATPYVLIEHWDRFRDKDYTVNAGSYFRLSTRSYIHAELGFGADRDYIYQTLARIEYEDRLSELWNWFVGFRYLNYPQNDVYILYPGLIAYWGDNYFQVFLNDGYTESRGSAQSVNFKGYFAVAKKTALYAGGAFGERLYDIFLLPACDQEGFIVFFGAEYKFTDRFRGRLGYSYSEEDPDFVKRSIEAGLTFQF